jgi:hypothetical protein
MNSNGGKYEIHESDHPKVAPDEVKFVARARERTQCKIARPRGFT